MSKIEIILNASPELLDALRNLSALVPATNTQTAPVQQTPPAAPAQNPVTHTYPLPDYSQVQPQYGQAPVPQQQYAQQAAPQYGQAPVPQQQYAPPASQQPSQTVIPGTVPTAAQTYTMEQLSVAATSLMDQGKTVVLQQLLQSFNVPSMMQLPKEQYGNFATQLRALGARI